MKNYNEHSEIAQALATICRTRNSDGSIPDQAKDAMKDELRNVIKYRTWEPVIPGSQV